MSMHESYTQIKTSTNIYEDGEIKNAQIIVD